MIISNPKLLIIILSKLITLIFWWNPVAMTPEFNTGNQFKWVAKLREYNQSDHLIALSMNMKSGYFGSTGRLEFLKSRALCYSFFIGIEKNLI